MFQKLYSLCSSICKQNKTASKVKHWLIIEANNANNLGLIAPKNQKSLDGQLPIIEISYSDADQGQGNVIRTLLQQTLISFQKLKEKVYLKEKLRKKSRRLFSFCMTKKKTQLNYRPCQWQDNKKKQTRQQRKKHYDETDTTGYEELMTKHEQSETRTRGQESTSENNQEQVWQ